MSFAVLLSFVPAAAARAEPSPRAVALTWDASDATCPGAPRILFEIDRILTGSTAQVDPPIEARARVERDGERWRLELDTRRGDAAGTRQLEGESCAALAEAMIVILVLMIDPALVPDRPPTLTVEPEPEPVVATAPAAPPPQPVAQIEAPVAPAVEDDHTPCSWGEPTAAAAAVGDVGALPGLAGGGAVSFAVRRCSVDVSLSARGLAPRRGEVAGESAGGRLWLASAGPAVGLSTALERWRFGGRVGGEIGAIGGRGRGIDNPRSGKALWLAASVGASIGLALSARVLALLELDAIVPLRRPAFVIDDLGEVHRSSPVTARATAGVAVRF